MPIVSNNELSMLIEASMRTCSQLIVDIVYYVVGIAWILSASVDQFDAALYALTELDGTYIGQLFVESNALEFFNVGGVVALHVIEVKPEHP